MASALTFTSAAFWSTGSAVLGQLIRFGLFVALSRLLTPVEFGIVALAAILVEVLGSLSDGGVFDAAVRRASLDEDDASTAFWLMLGLGVLMCLAALLLAPVSSLVFDDATVAPVMSLMCLTLAIAPLGSMHIVRATRALSFRKLAIWTFCANVAGGCIGIGLAFAGWGVWALAARGLVTTVTTVILAWTWAPWRPRAVVKMEVASELLSLGSRLLGSRMIGQANARGVELMAGLLIAPASVGILRIGGQCLNLLTQLTVAPLTQIAMPLLARSSVDDTDFRQAVGRITYLSALLIYPVFFGAMAVSSLVFPLVFGPTWALSGLVMPVLCALAVPLHVNLLLSAVLVARGRGDLMLRWSLLQAVLGLPLAALGAWWGLMPLVIAAVIKSYVLLPLALTWLFRQSATTPSRLLKETSAPFSAACVMALAVVVAKHGLTSVFSPSTLLLVLTGFGVLVFATAALAWDAGLRSRISKLLSHVRSIA